jgi:hypothetical protein
MRVIDKIKEKILNRFTIEISGHSSTYEDDPEEGQGAYVGSYTLEKRSRIATEENLATVVRAAIIDYVETVIGIDCDDEVLKEALYDDLGDESISMPLSVNVDRENNIPTDEQFAKWHRNQEELFMNDYDIRITINKAEMPITLVSQLLFGDDVFNNQS